MPKKFLIIFFLTAFSCLLFPTQTFAQLGKWFGPGEVSKSHESIGGFSDCTSCHSTGTPQDKCLVCHVEIKDKLSQDKGFHARNKDTKCGACHVEHKGKDANIVGLNPATFSHDKTDWPLTGAHATVKCENCHKEKRIDNQTKKPTKNTTYLTAKSACVSCHKDIHEGKLGVECRGCHDTTAWKVAVPTPSK